MMESTTKQAWATNTDYKEYLDEWMETINAEQWLALIERIAEQDLTGKTVLDFGCNRGVSLRVLYSQKPFAHGYGIDLDTEAIRLAKKQQGALPLTYQVSDTIAHFDGTIDIAFSHEVLYLLSDLDQHAAEMFKALKADGVYYVALGTHADNPTWYQTKDAFAKEMGIELQDYTLYQIADAFTRQGFTFQVRKFKFDQFLSMDYFKVDYDRTSMLEMIDYYSEHKMLFRFAKSTSS